MPWIVRICDYCQQPFEWRTTPFRSTHKAGKYCSRQCYDSRGGVQISARFWQMVERCTHEEDGVCLYCCWPWLAAKNKTGYGAFYEKKEKKRMVPAHRKAWEIFHKQFMPPHLFACHWCNVKSCVNPLHIFPGTPRMNTQHAAQCGLLSHGDRHYRSQLSYQDIATIRALVASGISQTSLARSYHVSKSTINNAVHHRSYKNTS